MRAVVQINTSFAMHEFERHLNHLGGLCDLECEWTVHDSRNAGLPASAGRIERPILVVVLSLLKSRRSVGNLAVRRIDDSALTAMYTPRRGMSINPAIQRKIQHLPDATEVGFPVRRSGNCWT